ncbi:MAG: hypothetical protein ACR2GW_08855, partial [Pyrinomonadaceae bacterium]
KVGQRVIDLTTQEILAVIKSGRSLVGSNHAAIIYILAFCVSPTNKKLPSRLSHARRRRCSGAHFPTAGGSETAEERLEGTWLPNSL